MISEHITLEEATQSQTAIRLGIENIPNEEQISAMKAVAEHCFEPMRTFWGKPLKVDSFFRCPELNKAVKGSLTSQHMKGEAIDIFTGSKENNLKLLEWAKLHLVYDQLIYEYGDETGPAWVHISFTKGHNRNEYLRIK